MSVKICRQCEESNKEGALICINCGSSLKDVPVEGTVEALKENLVREHTPQYTYDGSSGNGCAVALLFIATLFIPFVGLVVGGIFAFSDDYDKQVLGTVLLAFGLLVIIGSIVIGIAVL